MTRPPGDPPTRADLRLLLVVRPAAGGMLRHVSLLTRGLAERGVVVTLAAPPGAAPAARAVPPARRAIPLSADPHPWHDLRAALAVARLARGADVVHGHGLRGAWIGALGAALAGRPLVFTVHNLAPAAPGRLSRALMSWVVRRAAVVIAVSRAAAASLEPFGLAPGRTAVIPNGIDLAEFASPSERGSVRAALGVPEAAPLVAAVGRLSPEKGFDVLVAAARTMVGRLPAVRFVLAGDGPERDRLAALVRRGGLEAHFALAGTVREVGALLAAADAAAVPSRQEGQGIVALEAMACRTPVVASAVGGLVETVEDGVTGLLVPPDDPDALAAALLRLLDHDDLRRRLADAGGGLVEERYTAEAMVDATVDVYRRVCAG